jgi:adenylate cyclase
VQLPFPAYVGSEPFVFVCYAHTDAARVYPELARLHEGGLNVWYDEGISPGHVWTDELANAIDAANRFLYFVTPASVASPHCRRELQYALDQRKSVIVVYLEDTALPGGLKLSLGLDQGILKYQMDAASYRRKLARALQADTAIGDGHAEPTSSRSGIRNVVWTAAIAAIVIASGVWYWSTPTSDDLEIEAAADPERPTIAVVPFVNMSNDPDQEFFSDGIAEDILNELAGNPGLTVRPRSSTFQFKSTDRDGQSIGRLLNVTHVLEGSVRTAGDRVRVTTQLIDVAANQPVWSKRFDHELTDIFAVQDAITREILDALGAQLVDRDSRRSFASIDAYQAFLKGRHQFNRHAFEDADRWLATAVELDPGNAAAWVLRAQINAYQSSWELRPNGGDHRERRLDFIEKALALDPDNGSALANRGLMDTLMFERDFQGAVNELVTLARLHPNNEDVLTYLALVLCAAKKAELVDYVTRHVVTLAPLSYNARFQRAGAMVLFGRIDEARGELAEMSELGFGDATLAAQLAMYDRNADALRSVLANNDVNELDRWLYSAVAAWLDNDLAAARTLIAPMEEYDGYVSHRRKMFGALLRQDNEQALAHFRDAVRANEQLVLGGYGASPSWRAVFPEFYRDPRFEDFLAEARLDAQSMAGIQVPALPF